MLIFSELMLNLFGAFFIRRLLLNNIFAPVSNIDSVFMPKVVLSVDIHALENVVNIWGKPVDSFLLMNLLPLNEFTFFTTLPFEQIHKVRGLDLVK